MTWNEKRERVIAAAELGDATPCVAADLLVDARNRAFNAEQKAQELQTELDALKAAHAWIGTSAAKSAGADYVRCRACASDNADTCQPLNGPDDMLCPCGKLREPYDCQADEWIKA